MSYRSARFVVFLRAVPLFSLLLVSCSPIADDKTEKDTKETEDSVKNNAIEESPRFQRIARAYQELRKYAEKTMSPFGEKFVSHAPASDLYAEGFFSLRDVPALDFINRKFMPLSRYTRPHKDPLAQLYDRSDNWKPNTNRRASGILFMGYKRPPADIQKDSGIWGNLFKRVDGTNLRAFEQLARNGQQISRDEFNLERHLSQTNHSAFVSLTRSVHVARHFAIFTGSVGQIAEEGFVLVILADQAFDTHDDKNINGALHFTEQELTVSGVVPWGHIVGYREVKKVPSKNAPSELVGPIFLRENFSTMEPELAKQVMTYLSTKTKHTEAHEKYLKDPKNNKPWEKVWDAINRDGNYRDGFKWEHDFGL